MQAAPVILFDGVCGLCNYWVDFVLKRDRKGSFRFAALQSNAGRELLKAHSLPLVDLDSVVVITEGRVYERSAAVLEIARRLGFPWSIFWVAVAIPAPIRDFAYKFVAKHRYRWFGKIDTCRLPTPAERSKFLT